MRFNKHVSLVRDIVMMYDFVPIVASLHEQLLVNPPPAPPVPVPMGPFVETPAPIFYPPGALGAHKLTQTVYHSNCAIALSGHDLGRMLIHIPEPPNDVLWPLHTLMSSRKAAFEAGEVKANGSPIACCTMVDLAIVPTPMIICAKVTLPLAGTGTAVLFNNLLVGMHWIDLVAGWLSVVVQFVFSFVERGSAFKAAGPGEFSRGEFLAGNAAGLVRLAGQEWGGYHGDATLGGNLFSGLAGEFGITATRSGEDGRWSGAAQGRLGSEMGNAHGGVSVRQGGPGEPGAVYEGTGGLGVLGESEDGRWDSRPAQPGASPASPWSHSDPLGTPPIIGNPLPSWDDVHFL